MHLILTGATGLVGSGVLHHILSLSPSAASSKQITRLSVLARRPEIPLLTHPQCPKDNTYTKIEVITHSDFGKYDDEIISKLGLSSSTSSTSTEDGDGNDKIGVIWALGISQTETKSDEEYIAITKTFALEAAKAFSSALTVNDNNTHHPQEQEQEQREQHQKRFNFVYVSGEGVSHGPPKFYTPIFSKVKGETELALLKMMTTAPFSDNLKVYNVRPAGVDGINQPAVWDLAFQRPGGVRSGTANKVMMKALFPVLRSGVYASGLSPTEEIGKVLVDLAVGDGGALTGPGVEAWEGRVVRNTGLRRMARES